MRVRPLAGRTDTLPTGSPAQPSTSATLPKPDSRPASKKTAPEPLRNVPAQTPGWGWGAPQINLEVPNGSFPWTPVICALLAINTAFPPLNNFWRGLAQKTGINSYQAPYAPKTAPGQWFEWAMPDMDAIPDVGYSFMGPTVTETFDPESGHLGLRIEVASGYPIRAVAEPGSSVTVTCEENPQLGKTARMGSPSISKTFVIGNLRGCRDGEHQAGDVIARATGQEPGLYWQQLDEQGAPEPPQAGWFWWAGFGHEPNFKR